MRWSPGPGLSLSRPAVSSHVTDWEDDATLHITARFVVSHPQTSSASSPSPSSCQRTTRTLAMLISQLVTLLALGSVSSAVANSLRSPQDAQGRAQTPWTLADETDDLPSSSPEGDKVNVTLYVMSRCSDAVCSRTCRLLHDVAHTDDRRDSARVSSKTCVVDRVWHGPPYSLRCDADQDDAGIEDQRDHRQGQFRTGLHCKVRAVRPLWLSLAVALPRLFVVTSLTSIVV